MTPLAEALRVVGALAFGFLGSGLTLKFHLIPALAVPIDRGRTLRGLPLFGANKTWRGIVAVGVGTAVGTTVEAVFGLWPEVGVWSPLLGFAMGAAGMLAELPNSLLKRQAGVAPGTQTSGAAGAFFHVLDQVDLLAGAWFVVALTLGPPPLAALGWSVLVMYVVHQAVSVVGWSLGMRKTAR